MFSNISKDDGPAHNRIVSFMRDRMGFVWIGTYEGLSRFDGYTFKNFKKDQSDTNSIRANIINNIVEDYSGKIWIASDDYLEIFDPETETFSHWQSVFNGKVNVPIGSRWFYKKAGDGNIIYGNNETGICKYFVKKISVSNYNYTNSICPS